MNEKTRGARTQCITMLSARYKHFSVHSILYKKASSKFSRNLKVKRDFTSDGLSFSTS